MVAQPRLGLATFSQLAFVSISMIRCPSPESSLGRFRRVTNSANASGAFDAGGARAYSRAADRGSRPSDLSTASIVARSRLAGHEPIQLGRGDSRRLAERVVC